MGAKHRAERWASPSHFVALAVEILLKISPDSQSDVKEEDFKARPTLNLLYCPLPDRAAKKEPKAGT